MAAAISPIKLAVARTAGALSRRSGRGGGTSLPGKVLLKLQDDAIARLSGGFDRGAIVISATNGKTTTAAMIAAILADAGVRVVHNHAGANMRGGIAAALLDATRAGSVDGEIGLFEVDEAWTTSVVSELKPSVIVLGNLFRDQLDRYGELETLADSWREMISGLPATTTIVLNADDPLLATLGENRENVVHFGIEDVTNATASMRHAADSKFCRYCGSALVYDAVQLGHLGKYHCDGCGFTRPRTEVAASRVELRGMAGSQVEISHPGGVINVDLPTPGLYNVYNAVAATAAAYAAEIAPEAIAEGLEAAKAVFGRVEMLTIAGQDVALLLVKNPTGANEVLRTITDSDDPSFDLWIALNDGIADGRDISWIWDADFEQLAGRVREVTCSGRRADEMALRLAYAGIDRQAIQIDSAIEGSFDDAISRAAAAGTRLFALPTYTSLLELRTAISRRGDAPSYWEREA